MIVKMNGVPVDPSMGQKIGDGIRSTLNDWFGDALSAWFIAKMDALGGFLTDIMPDLVVFLILVCVTIGMFYKTGKMLGISAGIFVGGCIWLGLS